ncbi:hypothetical protein [Chitinibacter sp. S2-10]|uniref:hypothetical protein n=1 Tax=Chitinibacter sp. S2-10 TaxID=3373597 RepID=UPI0039773BE4
MTSLSQLTSSNSSWRPSLLASDLASSKPSHQTGEVKPLLQHLAKLQKNTQSLAQDFLQHFAGQMLGGASKGMKIEFDQVEMSASSSASMSLSQNSNGVSSTRSAEFSLQDSSSFVGRGTITTADGQKFDFELSIQYEASQTASYTQSTQNDLHHQFNGIADDLRQHISAEPVKLPFKFADNEAEKTGTMVLKLLNLHGGDRFFDWFGSSKPQIDQQA